MPAFHQSLRPQPSPPDSDDAGAVARLLLVCAGAAWTEAVRREAQAARLDEVIVANSADEAMALLAGRAPVFSYLLLEPSAADDRLEQLVSLTSGEAGPATALVLLGGGGIPAAMASRVAVTVADHATPGWLAHALKWDWGAGPQAPRPLTTEAELRMALEHDAVRVLYQPIVRLSDGKPLGVEALARVEHPVWGTLPPDYFLPGMEQAGLVREMTVAVVRRALSDWQGDRLAALDLWLALNLPLDILLLPCLADWMDDACAEAGVPAQRIVLELTETQSVTDLPALRAAAAMLRQRGYRLAIDDVGPAQRDATELIGLPFSSLKLDKTVVRSSADSPVARAYLHDIIGGAHAAGLQVVAEGVEDAEIWARMRALGADIGQGYAIARPLPGVAVPLWHHAWCAARRDGRTSGLVEPDRMPIRSLAG